MKIDIVGNDNYVLDLTKEDFFKVGKYIKKKHYTATEMIDLVGELIEYDALYSDKFAKEYAGKILSAVEKGNG